MLGKKLKFSAAITFGLLLCAVSALAAPIDGSFSGTGWATVSFTSLNFCPNGQEPNGPNQPDACTSATGNVELGGGDGSFAGVTGDLNTIDSLNSTIAPIGATVSIPLWLEFIPAVGVPPISLTLTSVLAGSFSSADCFSAPAPGQTCTPVGSAFNLVNQTATTSSATFTIIGNAVNGVPGDTSPFEAVFSSQFNVPYQTLLLSLFANNNTGTYSSSYSLSVDTNPIPEPMTLSLVGGSLIGLVMWQRRRAARK